MSETSLHNPTATGRVFTDWTNPTNAYVSNDTYATSSLLNDAQDYGTFNFNINSKKIQGIEVQIEGKSATGSDLCYAQLSFDNGLTWTSQLLSAFTTTEGISTLGGSSTLWGESNLTGSDFDNGKFLVGLIRGDTGTLSIDNIRVKVYYLEQTDGTVKVSSGTLGTSTLNTDYPITEGLTAGTTKQTGKNVNLTPQEISTW